MKKIANLQYVATLIENFIDLFKKNLNKVKVKNKKHLELLIQNEIKTHGNDCDLNHFDVSSIKDMSYLFNNSNFNGNISQWNTANVENMDKMFGGSRFNGDISKWNTSSVTNMDCMFADSQFNRDISNWDTKNVKTMMFMFADSQFNGDISSWNISQVHSMNGMFRGSKFDGDISKWDVRGVQEMNSMFAASLFQGDLSNWAPFSVRSWDYMLTDCPAPAPYWSNYENRHQRSQAIKEYQNNLIQIINEKEELERGLQSPQAVRFVSKV